MFFSQTQILSLFSHSKPVDDNHSSSSNHSSTSPPSKKPDENHPPARKRKTPSSTMISARGRKIHLKHHSDHDSDFDSDQSHSKRPRSSFKDYQSTLDELHNASEKFLRLNQNSPINNERFNKLNLTKLSHENLDFNQISDEYNDQRFLNSMNLYLEQFRSRLLAYFNYMKSDIYREHLRKQLTNEKELNQTLKAKVNCLEKNIKTLLEDAICLLKSRTNELGIDELEKPIELISYANDISNKHKDLRCKIANLEKEIEDYNHDNEKMNLILNNFQTNEQMYSKLLIDMSKQTERDMTKQSSILISPNSTEEKHFDFNQSTKKKVFF